MEQEVVSEKKSPHKEANRITRLLDTALPEPVRFPVNVEMVAKDLTPSFNQDPITAVNGGSMGSSIDGMLVKHDAKDEWAIFYNTDVVHPGRTNFTLAHELGHYMVHRQSLSKTKFQCGEEDMLDENQQGFDIEAEANAFAANLLMPNNDFRAQADGQKFSIDLMQHCADRYGVSLTAAVLKWLDFTKKRAIGLLSDMTMDEIKSLWRQLYRKDPPTHIRSFLEKRLAFRLQEVEFRRAHQNFADKNDRRINAIVNTGKKPLRDRYPKPIPGTVLSRIYQEKEHKVTVTHDEQFEFEGRIYKSLSVVAREITGTRWSGPLFFGLRKENHEKKTKRGKK